MVNNQRAKYNKIFVHKKDHSIDQFLQGILDGNRAILSKAITLVESSLERHQEIAQLILSQCLPLSGNSIRIGVTGVPGAGKSTYIEALGNLLISKGHKVAVLAIDPSSNRSKGSILGDKTRMEQLSVHENAFIRPSPSAGNLGGVARKTRESIILCEAAGFDVIIIETVGVGQSETLVHSMVDCFLLIMLAGAGDELQGIKRGIIEMADVILFNKADGDNLAKIELAVSEMRNALHYYNIPESGWNTIVDKCSAHTGDGIANSWEILTGYFTFIKDNQHFILRRKNQLIQLLHQSLELSVMNHFYKTPVVRRQIKLTEDEVINGSVSAYQGAQKVLSSYFHNIEPV